MVNPFANQFENPEVACASRTNEVLDLRSACFVHTK